MPYLHGAKKLYQMHLGFGPPWGLLGGHFGDSRGAFRGVSGVPWKDMWGFLCPPSLAFRGTKITYVTIPSLNSELFLALLEAPGPPLEFKLGVCRSEFKLGVAGQILDIHTVLSLLSSSSRLPFILSSPPLRSCSARDCREINAFPSPPKDKYICISIY